jgi:hypothetical protein
MVSFQLILRDNTPSSLAVQVEGYAEELLARTSGSLSLEVSQVYAGQELAREAILTVPIDTYKIRTMGDITKSNLSGSAIKEFPGSKSVTLENLQYESYLDGQYRYRAAYDANLEPGDTVTADMISFSAGNVSLSVNIDSNGGVQETMEVGEAV